MIKKNKKIIVTISLFFALITTLFLFNRYSGFSVGAPRAGTPRARTPRAGTPRARLSPQRARPPTSIPSQGRHLRNSRTRTQVGSQSGSQPIRRTQPGRMVPINREQMRNGLSRNGEILRQLTTRNSQRHEELRNARAASSIALLNTSQPVQQAQVISVQPTTTRVERLLGCIPGISCLRRQSSVNDSIMAFQAPQSTSQDFNQLTSRLVSAYRATMITPGRRELEPDNHRTMSNRLNRPPTMLPGIVHEGNIGVRENVSVELTGNE